MEEKETFCASIFQNLLVTWEAKNQPMPWSGRSISTSLVHTTPRRPNKRTMSISLVTVDVMGVTMEGRVLCVPREGQRNSAYTYRASGFLKLEYYLLGTHSRLDMVDRQHRLRGMRVRRYMEWSEHISHRRQQQEEKRWSMSQLTW